MILDRSHWKIKTALIEILTVGVGFGSVLVYNRVFDDAVPPAMGIVVGAINAMLVGWCLSGKEHDRPSN